MKREKRSFTHEQQLQFIREHLEGGLTIKAVCAKHDLPRSTLTNWLAKYRSGGDHAKVAEKKFAKEIAKHLPPGAKVTPRYIDLKADQVITKNYVDQRTPDAHGDGLLARVDKLEFELASFKKLLMGS